MQFGYTFLGRTRITSDHLTPISKEKGGRGGEGEISPAATGRSRLKGNVSTDFKICTKIVGGYGVTPLTEVRVFVPADPKARS